MSAMSPISNLETQVGYLQIRMPQQSKQKNLSDVTNIIMSASMKWAGTNNQEVTILLEKLALLQKAVRKDKPAEKIKTRLQKVVQYVALNFKEKIVLTHNTIITLKTYPTLIKALRETKVDLIKGKEGEEAQEVLLTLDPEGLTYLIMHTLLKQISEPRRLVYVIEDLRRVLLELEQDAEAKSDVKGKAESLSISRKLEKFDALLEQLGDQIVVLEDEEPRSGENYVALLKSIEEMTKLFTTDTSGEANELNRSLYTLTLLSEPQFRGEERKYPAYSNINSYRPLKTIEQKEKEYEAAFNQKHEKEKAAREGSSSSSEEGTLPSDLDSDEDLYSGGYGLIDEVDNSVLDTTREVYYHNPHPTTATDIRQPLSSRAVLLLRRLGLTTFGAAPIQSVSNQFAPEVSSRENRVLSRLHSQDFVTLSLEAHKLIVDALLEKIYSVLNRNETLFLARSVNFVCNDQTLNERNEARFQSLVNKLADQFQISRELSEDIIFVSHTPTRITIDVLFYYRLQVIDRSTRLSSYGIVTDEMIMGVGRSVIPPLPASLPNAAAVNNNQFAPDDTDEELLALYTPQAPAM